MIICFNQSAVGMLGLKVNKGEIRTKVKGQDIVKIFFLFSVFWSTK